MRFKLDENLGASIAEFLRKEDHDVSTVPEEGLSGADDQKVFSEANEEQRTLVTLDLDFSNPIRFPPGHSHGVIVIRVNRPNHSLVSQALEAALPQLAKDDVVGAIWMLKLEEFGCIDPTQKPERPL